MKRLLTGLVVAVLAATIAGCAGVSQGLARTAAAISGQEVTHQGKLGHADGSLRFIKATPLEVAHYELKADGLDKRQYELVIFDLEILRGVLGVAKHDRISFAGIELPAPIEDPPDVMGDPPGLIDDAGRIVTITSNESPSDPPIRLEVTRLKLR